MRPRSLSVVVGSALVGSALVVMGLGTALLTSADAAGEGTRLFLRSAGGGYAADLTADPSATVAGHAPNGSTLSPDAPTATTSDTATVRPTANAPASGQPDTPSFKLPVTGSVTSVCLDVFASGPAGASISLFGFLSNNNDATTAALSELKVTPYPGGIVRLTGIVRPSAAFAITAAGNFGFFAGALNGPGSNVVISYDSVTHPSNVTVNPTACTPVPVAAPSGSASATATATASATSTAAPSASPDPSTCPSPTSGTPAPTGSATVTATPSATVTAGPSVSASPSVTASTTATAAPSVSATTAPTPAPSSTPPAGCGTAARISLTVNVPVITAGNTPTLSGLVVDADGSPVAGATVDILGKGYAQTAYSRVGTAVTNAQGRYQLRVQPIRLTAYGANIGTVRSPVITVRVNTRVDITTPAPGAVTNPVIFTGQLLPRFAGVAVGLGYLTNGRFVVLTQAKTRSTGGYTISATLPRGTFTFIVFTSAHAGTDKGSKSVRLTVR